MAFDVCVYTRRDARGIVLGFFVSGQKILINAERRLSSRV